MDERVLARDRSYFVRQRIAEPEQQVQVAEPPAQVAEQELQVAQQQVIAPEPPVQDAAPEPPAQVAEQDPQVAQQQDHDAEQQDHDAAPEPPAQVSEQDPQVAQQQDHDAEQQDHDAQLQVAAPEPATQDSEQQDHDAEQQVQVVEQQPDEEAEPHYFDTCDFDEDGSPESQDEVAIQLSKTMDQSIISVNSSDEETDSDPAVKIKFRQAGGPLCSIQMFHGWMDCIEGDQWLNDDMIRFMCVRMAQVVPFERLRLLSSHYYDTVILGDKVSKWDAQQPVVCLPILSNHHWVLVVIVSDSENKAVFYFDSLNKKNAVKPAAKVVAAFLRVAGVPNVNVKAIKVPQQDNGNDCGLHVISHFASIVRIVDKFDNEKIAKEISRYKFNTIIDRAEAKKDIEDAFSEALYHKAYWGKYSSVGSPTMWWPCRRISVRLAKRLDPSKRPAGKIPVIWMKKEIGDILWVMSDHLKPLSESTLGEMIAQCSFTVEETDLLRIAYAQAIEY